MVPNRAKRHIKLPEQQSKSIIQSLFIRLAKTEGIAVPISSQLNTCLFKVNKRNTRKRCVICSKLTIKTPDRRQ